MKLCYRDPGLEHERYLLFVLWHCLQSSAILGNRSPKFVYPRS